jgi:hypothetical protein
MTRQLLVSWYRYLSASLRNCLFPNVRLSTGNYFSATFPSRSLQIPWSPLRSLYYHIYGVVSIENYEAYYQAI